MSRLLALPRFSAAPTLRVRPMLAAFVLLAGLSFANPQAGRAAEADAFIRTVGSETLEVLAARSADTAKREALVRDLLEKHLDLEGVSRFCLGRYGRQLSDGQAKEYDGLFVDYMVKVYSGLLAQYDGQTLSVQDGVNRDNEATQIVLSQINRKSGPPIRVEWKVINKGGVPKVTDVIIEGVSMAFTQRQQFESVLQNNGGKMDALFTAMRRQISR